MARKKIDDSRKGLYRDLPNNLKTLLGENNMQQAELAEELHMTRQNINNYCNGTHKPDYETILKIAEHFDVSVDWLIGRKGAVRSADISLQKVCKYTGLSEKTVQKLHAIQDEIKELEHDTAPLLKGEKVDPEPIIKTVLEGVLSHITDGISEGIIPENENEIRLIFERGIGKDAEYGDDYLYTRDKIGLYVSTAERIQAFLNYLILDTNIGFIANNACKFDIGYSIDEINGRRYRNLKYYDEIYEDMLKNWQKNHDAFSPIGKKVERCFDNNPQYEVQFQED